MPGQSQVAGGLKPAKSSPLWPPVLRHSGPAPRGPCFELILFALSVEAQIPRLLHLPGHSSPHVSLCNPLKVFIDVKKKNSQDFVVV